MRKRLRAWGSGLLVAGVSAVFLSGGTASAVSAAQDVPDGSLPFVAKVTVGDQFQSCTGTLVDTRWIMTAKSCFADGAAPVSAGVPTRPATVVLGRADLTRTTGHRLSVVSLVPHPDRNIVLAELSAAVTDIAPVPLSTSAPRDGESLRVAGYGRTGTEWIPDRMHSGVFTVGAVSAGGFAVDSASTGATLCKGDAGAPALRQSDAGFQLVGVANTSGQKGCLGEPDSRTTTGATESRADDLADWVRGSIAVRPQDLREPVTGEFTRDGRQDLVGTDAAGNLWLYPGTATPNVWDHRRKIGTGWSGYRELEIGRINRDDYDDLIAIETSTNILWMYPGTASGGAFGARVQIGAGWTTDFRDVAIGKVNRDAYDDLLVVKNSTQQLLLYKGNATGPMFDAGVQYGLGWGCCKELQVGKFTNDDYDDLLTVESSTGKMRIYAGTAAGTQFAPGVDAGAGTAWNAASYVAKGTVDGTGLEGLIEVEAATGKTWLHPRTAAGGWDTRVQPPGTVATPQPGEMASFVTGEFTRDAHTDLIGADSAGVLWLYPGTAARTFGARVQIGSGWSGYRELSVGRINRDDYDDLVAIETSTNILWMYPGTASGGTFGARVQIGLGWTTDLRDVVIGKVNRDAYDDLLVVKNSTQQLLLYKGNATGPMFDAGVQYGLAWGCCKELNLGRFNADGYADLQTVDASTGKMRLYAGSADAAQFLPSVDPGAGSAWLNKSNLFPVTFGSDIRAGLLAKDDTGTLLLYPAGAGANVDWSDPIPFGPRD
ncbi:trypsin-like serine protease [Krasilnikovia sp. MM14-A1004]|uniref:trypsin-like serine protease n=1 Tax=Krasilnikovia sp. MM14-A1004 TaxID=3373541 RepID=UPI00399C9F3A